MLRIFEYDHQIRRLFEQIEDLYESALDRPDGGIDKETGEVLLTEEEQEAEARAYRELAGLEVASKGRCLAYAKAVKEMGLELKEHQRRKRYHERRMKSLEQRQEFLQSVIEQFVPQGKKEKDTDINIYWSQTAEVLKEGAAEAVVEKLPSLLVKVTKEPRKSAIVKELQRGGEVCGLELERRPYLVIR